MAFSVVSAFLLFTALLCAWFGLFVALPLYGIWRAYETGQIMWAIGCLLASALCGCAWWAISRKLGHTHTFSNDSGPLL